MPESTQNDAPASTPPHINLATRNEKRKEYWTAVPNAVVLDPTLSDAAFRLYSLMLIYAHQADGCKLSQAAIAADMGKDTRTVRRLIKELEAVGLVTSKQCGLNENNVYIVEPAKTIADKNVRSHQVTVPDRTKMPGQAGQKSPVRQDKNARHKKNSGEEKKEKNVFSPSAFKILSHVANAPKQAGAVVNKEGRADGSLWETDRHTAVRSKRENLPPFLRQQLEANDAKKAQGK